MPRVPIQTLPSRATLIVRICEVGSPSVSWRWRRPSFNVATPCIVPIHSCPDQSSASVVTVIDSVPAMVTMRPLAWRDARPFVVPIHSVPLPDSYKVIALSLGMPSPVSNVVMLRPCMRTRPPPLVAA